MSIKDNIMLSYLTAALIIGFLGGFAFYHDIDTAEGVAVHQAVNTAKTLSLFVASEPTHFNADGSMNVRKMQEHIDQLKDVQDRAIAILDLHKRVIADTNPGKAGTVFSGDPHDEVGLTLQDGQVRLFSGRSEAQPAGIRVAVIPIKRTSGERIGAVLLEYTPLYNDIMSKAKGAATKFLLLYMGGLLLSIVVGYFVSRHISRPLIALKDAALKVAGGELDTRVEHRSSGELGLLTDSFNTMTAGLKRSRDELLLSHQKFEAESSMREKSEKALQESEQKLRTLFEFGTDAFFLLDLEGNFIDINRTAYERLGYTKEEMLSMHISRLDPPEFAAKLPERFEQIQKQGWAVFESAHLRKDGTAMPVEINTRIMDLGHRKIIFSAIRDITERKRAEDALRAMNYRLNALVEAIPDMVVFKDVEGRHLLVNKAVEDVAHHSRDEILGKTVEELLPPGPAAICRQNDESALRRLAPINVEEQLPDGKGGTMHIEFVKAPIIDGMGNLIGLVSVGRDITERKWIEAELKKHGDQLTSLVEERTAELKKTNEKLVREIAERERMEAELLKAQKLESLGILAGGIAHDFNNLLTAIMGNVSLALLDLDEGNPVGKQLAGAERALLRAQDLTEQLLTFSKGGAPIKRTMSIAELLQESLGFALRGSRIRCEFFLPDDLWYVDADEGQLSQVIHNLAINADQAMPGGGMIMVTCENAELSGGAFPRLLAGKYVKIAFEDHGVGIPREHLVKIFDPYFTTKQRGSGLGLATTYSIIQKHGGHITVESTIGQGTTFTLYLPASRSRAAEKKVEEAKPFATVGGSILIMDDEESVRQTTGEALRRFGYSVAFADDGRRAIEMYREALNAGKPFDVVIMDLTIPGGMGGRETLQHLVSIDPKIRAIVSSGYSNDPVMAEYRDYGFAGVVSKPYRIRDLSETVQRVIAGNNPVPDPDTATGQA